MEKIRAIVVAMIKALAVKTKAVWPYRWWILDVTFFLLPIICYFCIYHDGLSSDYNAWIAFGTLWGAVFGSLAFIIAIRTVYEGRKNAEREQIFNLLNLHQQKVEAVIYQKNGSTISGYDAFRAYTRQADKYLALHLIIRELQTNGTSRFPILTGCQSELFAETKKPVLGIKINMYRDIKCIDTNWQDWSAIALVIAYSDKLSAKDRVQAVAEVYGQLYEENGHFLGQYFRNMYYVLNTIDQSSLNDTDKAYYAHLYRAQLSRYELALGVFNAVWEKSSFDMVRLLLKYDILDDVYREDIVLFEKGEGKDDFAYHRVKDLLKEYQTMEKERQEQTSSLFTV